jgi:hypothetical protein
MLHVEGGQLRAAGPQDIVQQQGPVADADGVVQGQAATMARTWSAPASGACCWVQVRWRRMPAQARCTSGCRPGLSWPR